MTASSTSQDLEWLPQDGPTKQLFILLHGVGSTPQSMQRLAQAVRRTFPQAAVLAPAGFEPFDGDATRRQWFSVRDVTEANRPARVMQAMPAFIEWVRQAQARFHLLQTDTALAGFSQGAMMALESTKHQDGLAGRILAFSGRYAELPNHPPEFTTVHMLHGEDDNVMPVTLAQAAHAKLALLRGDATLDVASQVGHELHDALIEQAIARLQTYIPLRSWEAALGLNQSPPTGETVH